MICLACQSEMSQQDFNGVAVNVCEGGCRGIWFDAMGLVKVLEIYEGLSPELRDAIDQPLHEDAGRGRIPCPRCGISLQRRPHRPDSKVTVDECYSCGGFFLDAGELGTIREESRRRQSLSAKEADRSGEELAEQAPLYLRRSSNSRS